MSVRIMVGDCRVRLRELADNSVDSVVCDPPYHLTSIVKRFGSPNAAPAKVGATGAFARASKGFMGQTWDGGDVAFDPATWAEVLRVLKPGGHLVAFSGTRTYHRMVCAIDDAGFEVRDSILDLIASDEPVRQFLESLSGSQVEAFFRCIEDSQFGGLLAWVYGSGFPKSLDVSKQIDKRGGADIGWFGPWLRSHRRERGISSNELAKHFPSKTGGETGCVRNWELGLNLPTPEQFNLLCRVLDLPFDDIAEAEREVVGHKTAGLGSGATYAFQDANDKAAKVLNITAPATDAAREWQGWGTALKPSWEPICLARKPLAGTVAANVLAHGTGALNIDGCRIEGGESTVRTVGKTAADGWGLNQQAGATRGSDLGRWPANLCHDGSEEVLAGFPDSDARDGATKGGGMGFSGGSLEQRIPIAVRDDSGSAARFFYCAKATTEERGEGNDHPTVKPQALMRWLCRLVTPKGGTVLDPFMGSGSTGLAAESEQFQFIGIEMSPEYAAIAEKRLREAGGMFAQVVVDHGSTDEEGQSEVAA